MNRLNNIETFKPQIENRKVNKNQFSNSLSLEKVAKDFESLYVHQMMKSARSAKLAETIFNSEAQETYQNLLDQEYSKSLANNHNFGIAEALIRQFDKFVNKDSR